MHAPSCPHPHWPQAPGGELGQKETEAVNSRPLRCVLRRGNCWSQSQKERAVLESIIFVKYICDNTTATTKEFTAGSIAAVAY